MTFRSDLEALRMRVTELDAELAALRGRERGLRAAVVDAEERRDAALAKRARIGRWRALRKLLFTGLFGGIGLAVGVLCATGGLPLIALTGWCGTSADVTASATVESGATAEARDCRVTVRDPGDGRCTARIACGARTAYAGSGHCGRDGGGAVTYWDHARASEDGTPRAVVAFRAGRAAVDGDPPLQLVLAPAR